jgi:hypothetical protein
MSSDDDVRTRILKILDDARTFTELRLQLIRELPLGVPAPEPLGCALDFLRDGDATLLDAPLQERFAQVLSRFVESRRALELAGMLEAGTELTRS